MLVRALVLAAAAVVIGSPAGAQQRTRMVAEADSAFAAGNLALADSLYYLAVRYWPRDPHARTALGRYLGSRGKAKPAAVLLEEARMFGGDPSTTGGYLAPLYEQLGEWRALLTLPGSPLSIAERRRAAWMSEHPLAARRDAGSATIVGAPRGDTIARVAVRIAGRSVMATMLGVDAGFAVGTQIGGTARAFQGDPTVIVLDSLTVAQVPFVNVPALIGVDAATVSFGVSALGRRVVQIDYARNRMVITGRDAGPSEAKYPLIRRDGRLRVLDRGRWIELGEFAATVARAAKSLIVDLGAAEVRVRP